MSLDALPGIIWLALAVPVGAAVAVAHLALLHHAIQQATKAPHKAGLGIVLGFPLRLGLWIPFLWLAARLGLEASVGLILGSLIGRWGGCYLACFRRRPAPAAQQRG